MVLSILFNGLLHQTRERRKHIDWGINLLIVKLTINKYLSLSNVACQIGNRMSDIVILNRGIFTGIERMGI